MKTILKRMVKGEKGAALIAALVLLLVGGLVAASLLGYMGSGILVGRVYDTRTAELYAADAGVEDAIWKIQHQDQVPEVGNLNKCDDSWSYNISDAEGAVAEINSKRVEVTITVATVLNDLPCRYWIQSRAIDNGSGSQVEAYVDAVVKSSGILDHVITTPCDYTATNPTQIEPLEGDHAPAVSYTGAWPPAGMLSDLYWEDVKDYPYNSEDLDVENHAAGIDPLYRNGTLTIKNTGTNGLTVKLNGTVYVRDYTLIGQTNQDFTLDLNGQTIFVACADGSAPEDDPCSPGTGYALRIGGKCTLIGSGCIIAVGNIEFKPNLSCDENDYILVLSVSGKTYMQPNGDFYGTLAGNAEVEIQNGDATWTDYSLVEGGLNFPDLAGVQWTSSCSIYSYEVNPL